MAIKIYEKFAPRANPADGDYPYGSIKNESVPGAKDGTPLDATWANDYAGFDATLLAEAGIVPSGAADKLGASQRVDAIKLITAGGYAYKKLSKEFGSGELITSTNQVVKYTDNMWYYFKGALPHVNSELTPTTLWGNAGLLTGYPHNSPMNYGAKGDGINGDSVPLTLCIANNNNVDATGIRYRIESTITIPSFRNINFDCGGFILDCAGSAAFKTEEGAQLISLHGESSLTNGVAETFLQLSGVTDTPTEFEQYTRLVNIIGVTVVSSDINNSIVFDKAASGITIEGCRFTTNNGLISNGKSVEIHCSNCVFFGWSAENSYGISVTSSGGAGNTFSEGFHFVNCSFDAFTTSIRMRDIFVFTLSNSWVTSNVGGVAIKFEKPTTEANQSTLINGCVILGDIVYDDSIGGYTYDAKISSTIFTALSHIVIGRECAGIELENLRFKNGNDYAIQFPTTYANPNVTITNCSADGTYNGLIQNNSTYSGAVSVKDSYGSILSTKKMKQNSARSNESVRWKQIEATQSYKIAGTWNTGDFISAADIDVPSGTSGTIKGVLSTNTEINGKAFRVYWDGAEILSGVDWDSAIVYASGGVAILDIPFFFPESYQGVKLLSVQYTGAGSITMADGSFVRIQQ